MSIHRPPTFESASQALSREFDILLKHNMPGYIDSKLSAKLRGVVESRDPPSNNMGGTCPQPPLILSQCEKQPLEVVNKTKIDWLSASTAFGVDAIRMLLGVIWPSVTFSRNMRGMPGYPDSDSIIVDGVQYGQVGYGAKHGRDFFSITGTGCRTLNDELIQVFYEALVHVEASISRIDICFDLYKGERTFDHALWASENLAFRRPRANRDPEFKVVQATNNGQNLGRTLYVGSRSGEVFGRIYEKGLEVFAKMPEQFRLMSEAREVMTVAKPDFADSWVRLEVEYKRQSKDRPMPLEMMLMRDRYFAGAYPYFADALGCSDGIRPFSVVSEDNVEFVKMTNAAKMSYGSLIHSMKECGFSDTDIVNTLTTGRNNDRLVRSGLLHKMKSAADDFKAANPDWDVPF